MFISEPAKYCRVTGAEVAGDAVGAVTGAAVAGAEVVGAVAGDADKVRVQHVLWA